MSTQQPATQVSRIDTTNLSPKARRLAEYLHGKTEDSNGELYIKGKFISDDVDLSPKEIGALMIQLQDAVDALTIEKWSYSSATTWRVTL